MVSSASLRPYESRLVDSVGSLAVVSLTLLTPTMLLPSSSGLIKFCLIACLRASASVAGWNLSDGDYARQLAFLKLRPTSLEVPVPILYQDNTPTDVATSQSDQGNGLNKKEWSMGGLGCLKPHQTQCFLGMAILSWLLGHPSKAGTEFWRHS